MPRTDTERLDWLLEQNRRGAYLFAVTTRADVDSLMDEDDERNREPLYRAVSPEGREP